MGLFASFFPGASSVANVGAKSAYYGVRAANALSNLAQKLKKSRTILWQLVSAVIKVSNSGDPKIEPSKSGYFVRLFCPDFGRDS